MPVRGGRGVNGKITYIKLDDFDATESLMKIRETDRDLLLILSEQLDWANRWIEAPAPLDDLDLRDKYISELKLRLMQMVEFCAEVINCIETDADVQDAITNVYNQYGTGVPMPPTVSGRNLLPEIVDCDRDTLWGAINQLVDSMHQNNIDAFEVVEVGTNLLERASLLFSAIPVVETLPVNEAIDYVNNVWTDDLFEAYNANDTTAYRDTIKCDLFCIAVGSNCYLSVDDCFMYFMQRISASAGDTFAEFIAYMATGTWVGTEINDMFFAGQILFLKYGNQFFEMIGLYPFTLYLAVGANDPSDDHLLLCDECITECIRWNRSNPFEWEFIDDGEGIDPKWRTANAGNDMIGSLDDLSYTGYRKVRFSFDLFEFDVVSYSYIRVITNNDTYSYAGFFTGDDYHDVQALINIPMGDIVNTIEFHITGGTASTSYQLNWIEICP